MNLDDLTDKELVALIVFNAKILKTDEASNNDGVGSVVWLQERAARLHNLVSVLRDRLDQLIRQTS